MVTVLSYQDLTWSLKVVSFDAPALLLLVASLLLLGQHSAGGWLASSSFLTAKKNKDQITVSHKQASKQPEV